MLSSLKQTNASASAEPIYVRTHIPMHDLTIANFRTKFFSSAVSTWKETADVAVAMSCARQVWFGLKDKFTDFPGRENTRSGIDFYEGAPAYKYLLRLVMGLESKYVREDSIKGQVFNCWNTYETRDEDGKKKLEKIMQDIKADSRFINAAVLDGYKHYKHEISARDLSGQQKGERILIVGCESRHGKLSNFTDGIARVTGNGRNTRVSEIIITHPDRSTLDKLYDEMQGLKGAGILACDVTRVPFGKLCQGIEKAKHVYVDMPMGSNQEAEEFIQLAWQTRLRTDNNLVMLRGAPEEKGFSTPFWENAELDNYISPEMIRADMSARVEHNKCLLDMADKAIDFCVGMRSRGQNPSLSKVKNFLAEVSENPITASELPAPKSAVA